MPFGRHTEMQHFTPGFDPATLRTDPQQLDQRILNVVPEAAGPRLATSRGAAIYSVREPRSQTLRTEIHLAAVMLAPAQGGRTASRGNARECDLPIGALAVHPANVAGRAVWSYSRENLIFALKPESLLELAARELDVGRVSLQPPAFGTVDLRALRIAELLKKELTQPEPASELYVDSLVTLFSIHLLRNYSGIEKPPSSPRSGLSVRNAKRVQEFLNENFSRKLSVAELAAIADLSPSYFIRAFNKTFGQSPHQYLLKLRLTFAKKLLVEGNMKIAEIAYLSGFSSQSHLTAAMKKNWHMTPAEIRRER